jgi:excisionase family DNA binding protein
MARTLYTVPEVATRLQVDPKTVRLWIRAKQITAIRVGREWRFRDEDIEARFMGRGTDRSHPRLTGEQRGGTDETGTEQS